MFDIVFNAFDFFDVVGRIFWLQGLLFSRWVYIYIGELWVDEASDEVTCLYSIFIFRKVLKELIDPRQDFRFWHVNWKVFFQKCQSLYHYVLIFNLFIDEFNHRKIYCKFNFEKKGISEYLRNLILNDWFWIFWFSIIFNQWNLFFFLIKSILIFLDRIDLFELENEIQFWMRVFFNVWLCYKKNMDWKEEFFFKKLIFRKQVRMWLLISRFVSLPIFLVNKFCKYFCILIPEEKGMIPSGVMFSFTHRFIHFDTTLH